MNRPLTWLVVAIGVIAIAVAAWLAMRDGGRLAALGGGQLLPADFYAVVDPDTIIVTGTTGEGAWTRITNVVEADGAVTISIRVLYWPGVTYASVGRPIAWTLNLARPLGDRVVLDGFQEVPRRDDPS